MKHVILIIAISAIANFSFGQTVQSAAFSESYQFEYNKDYSKAISSIDNVYDANSYIINIRLGWLNYLNGDYLKSQAYYKTAIKLEPSSIEARLGYAYPLSALNNWEDVITIYNQILSIAPNNYIVNYRMSLIYFNRKDFEKSITYAQKIISQYPFDYDLNLLLGKINIGLGKIDTAKSVLNRALLYNPSSTEVIELIKTL